MAARPGHPHGDLVAGGGDGAGPEAELADVDARVAVEAEDAVDAADAAVGHDLERAAGQLFGGLEDQAYAAGQRPGGGLLGQEERGAEQDRGVHVVAAGVAGARHGRAVGHVLLVLQRQRVDVGAQGDGRAVAAADVADQPGTLGQHRGAEAGGGEPLGDALCRAIFGEGQLRMHVEVAAECHEILLGLRQERVEFASKLTSPHMSPSRPMPCAPSGLLGCTAHALQKNLSIAAGATWLSGRCAAETKDRPAGFGARIVKHGLRIPSIASAAAAREHGGRPCA
ncbi:hypothetical protein GCM10020001_059070 [Nonomuraea salmonea]